MTFDYMNIERCPYYINCPSLVPTGLKHFKWGHFHIFSLSYNLTSDYLWPWHVTFDHINKWGFSCCIYDPSLVEIHQSMWMVENVNPIHNNRQQAITVNKVIPMYVDVSFQLRQVTQQNYYETESYYLRWQSLLRMASPHHHSSQISQLLPDVPGAHLRQPPKGSHSGPGALGSLLSLHSHFLHSPPGWLGSP